MVIITVVELVELSGVVGGHGPFLGHLVREGGGGGGGGGPMKERRALVEGGVGVDPSVCKLGEGVLASRALCTREHGNCT